MRLLYVKTHVMNLIKSWRYACKKFCVHHIV